VQTLGYYSAGDGGGNIYEIVAAATGTADGGSFIDLTGISGQAKGLFVDGVVNVKQFGAVGDWDGVSGTDNTQQVAGAFAYADANGLSLDLMDGTYLCGNFTRKSTTNFFGRGAKLHIDGVDIPVRNIAGETTGEYTVYVSPTGSDTANNGLSPSTPYRTLQHAVDSIEGFVRHRVTIQLADGVYSEGSASTNPINGASTVRTVRCLIKDKAIHDRDLLVFQGNATDNSLVTIKHDDVYSAFYVEETNGVVINDLTIDCSANPAAAISVFQHRRGDMRLNNVALVGNDFDGSHAVAAESGGFVEIAGSFSAINYERCLVALDAVISFIGTSLDHDGGTSTAPRTFEVGSDGKIDMFSGSLSSSNIQRLAFVKDGKVTINPSSSAITFTGFMLDVKEGAYIQASNLSATGGAIGLNCEGGVAHISVCTLTDQTTSAVVGREGAVVVIDDCTLSDNTNSKSVVDVENSTLVVKGDGDFLGGFRCILAKNSLVSVEEQANFSGGTYQIDAKQCKLRLKGSSANPITLGAYGTNALFLDGTDCVVGYINITNPSGKTSIVAIGSNITDEGGTNIDGGFRGVDLSQLSSWTYTASTASSLTNMSEGINARRGSQVYYRASSLSFSGTTTPTVEDTTKSAHVTSF
jgi:hypothetical protein